MFKSPIKTVAYGNQMTEKSDFWWNHFQSLFLNLFKLLSSISLSSLSLLLSLSFSCPSYLTLQVNYDI